MSILEPEVEFRRQGALFRIQFRGHISAADQDIFTKFGVLVENGILQRTECFLQTSKMADGGHRCHLSSRPIGDDTLSNVR